MAYFFPDELIQEIIAANDITELIGHYVTLKRSGSGFTGLCPFHREKTPSFHVSPDKGLYHCFGCGAGGTVVNFVMQIENLDFVDAVRFLAERANIRLPEEGKGTNEEYYRKKQEIYRMNAIAARYFYDNLKNTDIKQVKEYLNKRELDEKTVKSFGIGYAIGGDSLLRHLTSAGYDKALILEAGLISTNEKGRFYDRFRDRLMFPIIDVRGNVIGFGGRIFGDGQPKYLNSAENIVFNKGRNLYGLNFAKQSGEKRLVLVEGYMDVVSLHKRGVRLAIASLGTALTPDQARLISNYANEVFICYDTDAAGVKATERAIDILSGVSVKVRIIELSGGKDPDEYMKNNNSDAFFYLMKHAKSVVEYKLGRIKGKYDFSDLNQKIEFAGEAAAVLAKVENSIEREMYLKKIAAETEISQDAILAEMKKKNRKEVRRQETAQMQRAVSQTPIKTEGEEERRVKPVTVKAERILIGLLCADKGIYQKLKDRLRETLFADKLHREIFTKIRDRYEEGESVEAAVLLTSFPAELSGKVSACLTIPDDYAKNSKAAEDALDLLEEEELEELMKKYIKENNLEKVNEVLRMKSQKMRNGGPKHE